MLRVTAGAHELRAGNGIGTHPTKVGVVGAPTVGHPRCNALTRRGTQGPRPDDGPGRDGKTRSPMDGVLDLPTSNNTDTASDRQLDAFEIEQRFLLDACQRMRR